MLDKYNKLPYSYQSKIRYDTLIYFRFNVILNEIINVMGATIVHKDIELKMKISRRKYLESKLLYYDDIIDNSKMYEL